MYEYSARWVRVLTRMCPCADSYEPSLLERNIRLLKIVIFLFFSVRFYFRTNFLSCFKAVRVLARMCPCADSYELSLHVLYFVIQSTIKGLDNTVFERIIVNIFWKNYLDPRMSRFKAVRVLKRMCPCADSYEPSLLERNIRLLKIVKLLFFGIRFYFSANFFSRFKAVRVLTRMCPCTGSYELSLHVLYFVF